MLVAQFGELSLSVAWYQFVWGRRQEVDRVEQELSSVSRQSLVSLRACKTF